MYVYDEKLKKFIKDGEAEPAKEPRAKEPKEPKEPKAKE